MNLIEAIKSGRRFKRRGDANWCTRGDSPYSTFTIMEDALLADNWEIEEPSVTITRAQFWEAVKGAYPHCDCTGDVHLSELARKLGLGET